MTYTDPIFHSSNLIWYSRARFPDGFSWNNFDDLARYKVGITQGYAYGDELDSAFETGSLPVILAPTVNHLFRMLSRGRIDFALATDAVGYALARQYAPEYQLMPTEKVTGTEVHCIAFSKKSAARKLIPRINQILSQLKKNGFIDRTMAID